MIVPRNITLPREPQDSWRIYEWGIPYYLDELSLAKGGDLMILFHASPRVGTREPLNATMSVSIQSCGDAPSDSLQLVGNDAMLFSNYYAAGWLNLRGVKKANMSSR
ncbi:MAG: hypothetical protein QXT87_00505 [Thermoproteota archaeon]